MSEQPLDSQYASNRVVAVRELLEHRQYQQVIDECEHLLDTDETNVEACKLKVEALRCLGRLEEGRRENERALRIRPDDAMLWNDKALLLYAQKLYYDALRTIDIAIEKDENNADICIVKAKTLIKLERFDD